MVAKLLGQGLILLFVGVGCLLLLTLTLPFTMSAAQRAARAHSDLACVVCHVFLTEADQAAGLGVRLDNGCRDCHLPNQISTDSGLEFHQNPQRDCLSCHRFHETAGIKVGSSVFIFDYRAKGVKNHCRNCHLQNMPREHLSSGHLEAALFYHGGHDQLAGLSPSEGCLTCHSSGKREPLPFSLAGNPQRFHEQASHRYGVTLNPADGTGAFALRLPSDPRIQLIDNRIECPTCHNLTSTNDDLLPDFTQAGDLCLTCHRRKNFADRE